MTGTGRAPTLNVAANAAGGVTVLRVEGVLDADSYIALRDRIIDAALDEPTAVVADVTDLRVPAESAWAAFTSARWIVSRWPQVPIVLVCEHTEPRDAIARSEIAGRLPLFPTIDSALDGVQLATSPKRRRRARADLPAALGSLRRSRELVAEWLRVWSQTDLIPVTKVVVTAFVENVLRHTDSRPQIRLETDGTTVTVAVADSCNVPAAVRDGDWAHDSPSGLLIVAALCRSWGNAPTPGGKTVWAVIGPENRL